MENQRENGMESTALAKTQLPVWGFQDVRLHPVLSIMVRRPSGISAGKSLLGSSSHINKQKYIPTYMCIYIYISLYVYNIYIYVMHAHKKYIQILNVGESCWKAECPYWEILKPCWSHLSPKPKTALMGSVQSGF